MQRNSIFEIIFAKEDGKLYL